MFSYRCYIRAVNAMPAPELTLNQFVQLKADDAVEAQQLAHITTGCAVIEVVRIDG